MLDTKQVKPKRNRMNRSDIRMIITAGLGFFTDAYDLFIIGIVTTLLVPLWHMTPSQVSIMNSAMLIAAGVGAISFGWLADKFGRKRMYGIEIIILFIGALLCASAQSYTWLLIARIFVGIGIGGDYPSSAVVASEAAKANNRGLLVLLVFAMQAVGLIVGPLLASLLLWAHLPTTIIWRILLGIAAVPAGCVYFLRRQLIETQRFRDYHNAPIEVSRAVSTFSGYIKKPIRIKMNAPLLIHHWKELVACALAWFIFDIVFYGNSISSTLIIQRLHPHASLMTATLTMAGLFALFALPGYLLAATTVDKIGRKRLQVFGFVAIACCYGLLAYGYVYDWSITALIIIFGLSFFFCNFGPNTTTFLIPSEIFPTSIRARSHGIAAAAGKCGAFVGALTMPLILHHTSIAHVMVLLAIISLSGAAVTQWVKEMKQQSLDIVENYSLGYNDLVKNYD